MHNRPYGFEIYLVNVKTMRTIAQVFVKTEEKFFHWPKKVMGKDQLISE